MDIKIKMTESDYEYPFIYFENDGTYSSGITSMPFVLSSNEEFSNLYMGNFFLSLLVNLKQLLNFQNLTINGHQKSLQK